MVARNTGPTQQRSCCAAQVMDNPSADAASCVNGVFVTLIAAHCCAAVLGEYKFTVALRQHRQRKFRYRNYVVKVGLVACCWNGPSSIAVKLGPAHVASFISACCGQQNKSEQWAKYRVVSGGLPYRSKLIIVQYP